MTVSKSFVLICFAKSETFGGKRDEQRGHLNGSISNSAVTKKEGVR